ncbi:peptidoglycan-binding protein [Streptomyces sp. BI20]|uniref:peptidoglycan-binding protein n=1 Tax=Streptomyces sp. BI20 TaxID=3403460 RepID=UPI003C7274A9
MSSNTGGDGDDGTAILPVIPSRTPRDGGNGADDDGDGGSAAGGGLSRRRKWVAVVVVGAVVLGGAGFGATLVVKSPAQVAAETGPPPMDVLVARVERRVLRDTVIVRGTVSSAQSVQVTPMAGAGEGGAAPVVTKVGVRAGDRITAGLVLMEVSGRPLVALPGGVPVYRDLKPGATGNDVKQLQKALAGLGHGTGSDTAGTFGAGTKAALTAFYRGIGYDPKPAVADGGEAVEAAEDAVTAAERTVEDVRTANRPAPAAGSGASSGTGAGTGAGTTAGGAGGGKSVGGASGSGDGVRQLARAREDLAKARQRLAEARAAAGPMLPAGEVVFLESFPARADSVAVRPGSPATGVAMSLSAGAPIVRGQLQEHQKGLVRPGRKVEILSEVSGITAPAEVLSVADTPQVPPRAGSGTEGQGRESEGQGSAPQGGPAGYEMVVKPLAALDPKLIGQDVRLTVEAAATDGNALVVPVSAVSAGADGRTSVTVVDGAGTQRRVEVRPGTTGDGFVEVRPTASGSLKEGDSVVTGVNPGVAGKKDSGGPGGGAP